MRKFKCNDCKMEHGGFHICVDLSTPEPKLRTSTTKDKAGMDDMRKARWDRYREETAERDAKVVAAYKEGGIGYVPLAKVFNIHPRTAYNILKRAEAMGELVIRKRGYTIAKGAK